MHKNMEKRKYYQCHNILLQVLSLKWPCHILKSYTLWLAFQFLFQDNSNGNNMWVKTSLKIKSGNSLKSKTTQTAMLQIKFNVVQLHTIQDFCEG